MELIFLSLDRTLVGQRLEQLKEKSINQIQITLTMSLVNVNEISMVTIDNLITTAIKDISIKKKGTLPSLQMLLLTKPEMIQYNLKKSKKELSGLKKWGTYK